MSWNTVRLDQVAATPWRNGGGVTRELAAWPDADRWQWRISVADIGVDGPFSDFPGVTRWFAVLEGAGVRLQVDGKPHLLTRDTAPLTFDGGSAAHCTLIHGPTRDFNLMVRSRSAFMERVRGMVSRYCTTGALVALYTHRSGARVACDLDTQVLPARTLAWRILEDSMCFQVEGEDALWLEMGP